MSASFMSDYVRELQRELSAGNATEHTHRPTFKKVLENLYDGIRVTNEPKRIRCGAPDLLVSAAKKYSTIGYIETKETLCSLDEEEDSVQVRRYRDAIENLVLTNYIEFRHYVHGELRRTATIATLSRRTKKLTVSSDFSSLTSLLDDFANHAGFQVSSAKELAERMARLAHLIRDLVFQSFENDEASTHLSDLRSIIANTLIPDIDQPTRLSEFADMYAQTLVYGLFAARCNHTAKGPFKRVSAARDIPKTNPFLRKLFETLAGSEMDEEPHVSIVDDVVHLLDSTPLDLIVNHFGERGRGQDPVIHFYETFLSAYDPQLRDVRGVFYTPPPVVSYIVRSVDTILRTQFGLPNGLAETRKISFEVDEPDGAKIKKTKKTAHEVLILDPACGTGTFLYSIVDLIREQFMKDQNAGMWSNYVRRDLLPRLMGFELLMAPYSVAHFKLALQLAAQDLPKEMRKKWAYAFDSDERVGVYLTNSLEEAEQHIDIPGPLRAVAEEANMASDVKKNFPIMVVVGNPPYSGHSANRSKTKRNGKEQFTFIGKLVDDYYSIEGNKLKERNSKWLQDDYVKFIRWGQWRIERSGAGVLAFITNHGYLDNPTFRGMRANLLKSFDEIYVLDLHGNSKKKECNPDGSPDQNVFDIQQGVAIGFFIRRRNVSRGSQTAKIFHADLWGSREEFSEKQLVGGKYFWLFNNSVDSTKWTEVHPQKPFYLFVPQNLELSQEYSLAPQLTEIMPINVLGFQTHRDHFAIAFDRSTMEKRVKDLRGTTLSDSELRQKYELKDNRDWKLGSARTIVRNTKNWTEGFTRCLYRPFDYRECHFSTVTMDYPRRELLDHVHSKENLCLLTPRQIGTLDWRHSFVSDCVAESCVVSTKTKEQNYVFPVYINPVSQLSLFGSERSANFAPAFVNDLADILELRFIPNGTGNLSSSFGPEDLASYIYATLSSPSYRSRYSEALKGDYPRIPKPINRDYFEAVVIIGRRLIEIHLGRRVTDYKLLFPSSGTNIVDRVVAVPLDASSVRVQINDEQYFDEIPLDIWEYRVGAFCVVEKWLKERKDRVLSANDIGHIAQVMGAISETLRLSDLIDLLVEKYGGWSQIFTATKRDLEIDKVIPFKRIDPKRAIPFMNCIPLYSDLKVAAGQFGDNPLVKDATQLEQDGIIWVEPPAEVKPGKDLFIAQVVGESMNRRIPNGSWCVFRFHPKGSRQGKVVLASHSSISDPELGGGYTLKIYESEKRELLDGSWEHRVIILKPDSNVKSFKPIIIRNANEDEFQIVAELVHIVKTHGEKSQRLKQRD